MAVRARRALISVFDKLGLEELVRALAELDIEFVSTGGTAKAIRRLGSAPMWRRSPVSRDAGRRVKTLHPASTEACWPSATYEHLATLLQHQISPIDIVCVNLYARQTIHGSRLCRGGRHREHRHRRAGNVALGGQDHQSVCVLSSPAQCPEPSPGSEPTGPPVKRPPPGLEVCASPHHDGAIAASGQGAGLALLCQNHPGVARCRFLTRLHHVGIDSPHRGG